MKSIISATVLLACVVSSGAEAQSFNYWPAPAAASDSPRSYFPMGTPLALVTRTDLSTKTSKPGDRFYLDVAQPLVHQGQVVVPAGAIAVGEVVRAERNGHMGRKGKLGVRLVSIETPSGPVRLAARAGDEGKSQLWLAAGGVALVSLLFYFVHGTSGKLRSGTPVTAYLADDLHFAVRGTQSDEPRAIPASFGAAAKGAFN